MDEQTFRYQNHKSAPASHPEIPARDASTPPEPVVGVAAAADHTPEKAVAASIPEALLKGDADHAPAEAWLKIVRTGQGSCGGQS